MMLSPTTPNNLLSPTSHLPKLNPKQNPLNSLFSSSLIPMNNSLIHGGAVNSGQENNAVMSSEESSSYPDDAELELGLGLSLGGGGKTKGGGSWDHYARILTAKDFPTKTSSSSSSSSSSVTKANNTNGSSGTKRTADSPCSPPARSAISQVVGWPPVRTYRMNSLMNHAKSSVTEEFFLASDKCNNAVSDKTINQGGKTSNNVTKEKGQVKTSFFVKVNMDGIPIGRKVDLNAHSCYETLVHALDDMFTPNASVGARRGKPMRLLDGSSDFVLTYEDKEGDWMLVGDVPWKIFLNSVRRLRIMRTTDANGLAPGSQERNGR